MEGLAEAATALDINGTAATTSMSWTIPEYRGASWDRGDLRDLLR